MATKKTAAVKEDERKYYTCDSDALMTKKQALGFATDDAGFCDQILLEAIAIVRVGKADPAFSIPTIEV